MAMGTAIGMATGTATGTGSIGEFCHAKTQTHVCAADKATVVGVPNWTRRNHHTT